MERYRHTQLGLLLMAGLLTSVAACAYLLLHTGRWMFAAALVVLLAFLVLASSLTTCVSDGLFEVRFGPGLIHRRIALARIESVAVVENPWYYAWGIHWTPAGWLWNISGVRGVELRFEDGRRFRVGTDEPERLAEAICAEMEAG